MAIHNFSWIIPNALAGSAMPGGSRAFIGEYADADLAQLYQQGVRCLFSLAPMPKNFGIRCQKNDLLWLYYPIEDFGIPRNTEIFGKNVDQALQFIDRKLPVCVHCRAGIGRTGLGLSCIFGRYLDLDGPKAMNAVTKLRGGIETPRQERFIAEFLDAYRL